MTDRTTGQRWQAAMMNNYGTPALSLVSGEGPYVVDEQGNRYLDLLGGIAVNALGHANESVAQAVSSQVRKLGHTSNLYVNPVALELAEALVARTGAADARVFLCNSGAEANEAAFKIARRTGRPQIIAAENAFHGRTMGALALTGQPAKRAPFEPMPPGVHHVPFGDVDALAAAVSSQTAAVILEPILGEAGVITPPAGYLAAARDITAAHGALLIVDEVQTGIARTGTFFAYQQAGITPDVITLAKGLGGGLPIGATIALGASAGLLEPGQHGTTFGGNPVCAAAALAVLEQVDDLGLVEHCAVLGKDLSADIEALDHPLIDSVRGAGLLLGIVLTQPVSTAVEAAARAAGFLVNAPAPNVIRLAPPLILTRRQAGEFVAALPAILDSATPTEIERSAP